MYGFPHGAHHAGHSGGLSAVWENEIIYGLCVWVGAWVGCGRHGVISEWDKFIGWLEDLTRVSTGKGRDADEEGGSEFNIGMGKV